MIKFIILCTCLLLILSYSGYEGYDYKVYKQSVDSLIPKYKYRMEEYPYVWAYRGNDFPLEKVQEYERPSDPYGACLLKDSLWSCSLLNV
jgi:hypothetical protein